MQSQVSQSTAIDRFCRLLSQTSDIYSTEGDFNESLAAYHLAPK